MFIGVRAGVEKSDMFKRNDVKKVYTGIGMMIK